MVLATAASPQSELLQQWKPIEPPATVEDQSEPLTPPIPMPMPRPRPQAIQQAPKLPAAAQSKPLTPTPAVAHMHEQAIRQPAVMHSHEQYMQQPQRIRTRTASANDDFGIDARYLPRERLQLVDPPFLPRHKQATNEGPKINEVRLVAEEKDMVIDDEGTTLKAMTFNGTIPAPAIVVHEGDYVELTLVNPETNSMPHNIDFHAATGGLGGGDLTLISPGEQAVLRFKATRPGVFVYHCIPGGSMIPWHIMAGMSGVVMVLPRDGLKDGEGRPLHYDRAYYIGEQDMYVPRDKNGKFKTYATHADAFADTMELMHGLVPTHVVFNGRVGALMGKNALTAKVGENVLIIHSQADRDSRVHLIGGHGDYLWELGKFNNPPQVDAETWLVRGGSASVAMYKFLQPGVYPYVNHNMTEAVELGATAHFKVEGTWNDDLMTQVQAPGPVQSVSREPVNQGNQHALSMTSKQLGNQYGFSITSKESIREYGSTFR